ncbi:MAG: hypothetical protein CMJ78_26555, partial [Planctomycetaceae bacterium]|nr:hypothetical protein [Planctomycetaceae bacterium]
MTIGNYSSTAVAADDFLRDFWGGLADAEDLVVGFGLRERVCEALDFVEPFSRANSFSMNSSL